MEILQHNLLLTILNNKSISFFYVVWKKLKCLKYMNKKRDFSIPDNTRANNSSTKSERTTKKVVWYRLVYLYIGSMTTLYIYIRFPNKYNLNKLTNTCRRIHDVMFRSFDWCVFSQPIISRALATKLLHN